MNSESTFLPTFLRKLQNPNIKNILMAGCGGGFDFIHGMLLYQELKRLKKNITIASYSWTTMHQLPDAPVVFEQVPVEVKKVDKQNKADEFYAPEILLCRFLDEQFPNEEQHSVYALYARDFTVSILTEFYRQLVQEHNIDCILLFDGGSDGLMKGDEAGIGDPTEDGVSLAAVSNLAEVKERIFITAGLGADRNNDVADAAALRAIAEITRAGGFYGSISLEEENINYRFYRDCVEYIFANQKIKSGVSPQILAAVQGYYGGDEIPPYMKDRSEQGCQLFVWPLMAMLFGFSISTMAERSLIVDWIRDSFDTSENWTRILSGRQKEEIRDFENFVEAKGREDHSSIFRLIETRLLSKT